MQRTILVTGSTDGIGLETAKMLVSGGHHVLLHGRNPKKVEEVERTLSMLPGGGRVESYVADLSLMTNVEDLARAVSKGNSKLDVLINNAGVFKTNHPITKEGLDVRFGVNTIAPFLLTRRLLPLMKRDGRVINVSSAAQRPVNLEALAGRVRLSDDMAAYAQSKLALAAWSRHMALEHKDNGPIIISVNPGSLLGTNMVREGFGIDGGDVSKGANILVRLALNDEFATASGLYFDNDAGKLAPPHPDALDLKISTDIVRIMDEVLAEKD